MQTAIGRVIMDLSISDRDDIQEMRRLFYLKFYGEITQAELEREVEKIMGRQLHLLEAK